MKEIKEWRVGGEAGIGKQTITDWYSMCREVCEIVSSHHSKQLGGAGAHVEMDETFLTTRKYNRGRRTKEMTITIFGIYCRETKEGLFFRTAGKSKRDLWPLALKYIHPETSHIHTDGGKQYTGIDCLFPAARHMTVNHSKGEYVQKDDRSNHINSIENMNKILKREIKHLSNLHQYMALHYYRRTRMNQSTFGGRVNQFLNDMRHVYPGPNGVVMQLKAIDMPTAAEMGIEHLMPGFQSAGDHSEVENDTSDEWDEGNE